jgi:rod shape-determining protein MreD
MWYIMPLLLPSLFVYLTGGPGQVMAIYGALPELTLISLLYYGNNRGKMIGQMAGLIAGLTLDVLSAAPLGFFTFVFTSIGFIAGSTKGKVYVDPVFTPLLMIAAGLLLKGLLVFVLSGLFLYPELRGQVFGNRFLIQFVYTLVLGPLFYALFALLDKLFPRKRRGGYQD